MAEAAACEPIARRSGFSRDLFPAAAGAIAAYHYALIRERTREGCFKAFNHHNWFGAAVFAGLVLEYWIP